MDDLFKAAGLDKCGPEDLAPGAVLLHGRALDVEAALLDALELIISQSPFRHMVTPGGFRMSVAMTNCGSVGWITDRKGYRYDATDPETGRPWPAMPAVFRQIAAEAAAEAGYPNFLPDACLINRYLPGARLTLHQDRNERDLTNPVVSVSLGLPAVFQFGGLKRTDPQRKFPLRHGDVVICGGPTRLSHHGILPLKDGEHPSLGAVRYNLTFRKAL
jgi:alkylated DNA repair protein (DNA oxidative demethylase)